MPRQAVVKASEGHRSFGKLLKRVYHSDEHLIVERGGFPVAVILSYQEYERLLGERVRETFDNTGREPDREIEQQGLSNLADSN